MTSKKSTAPAPRGERQSFILREPVIGVRIRGLRGTAATHYLAGRTVWRVGSAADQDIRLDSPEVSRAHCTIELRQDRWIVSDQGSRNGIFDGTERRTLIELVPGSVFRIAHTIHLIAFDAAGERAFARMQHYFGLADRFLPAVENALQLAYERRHLVIQQAAGGGGPAIAREIHDVSPRRDWPFQIAKRIGETHADHRALLDPLAYGTLVARLDHLPAKPDARAALLDRIASWEFNVRLIAIAPLGARLAPVLGERLLTDCRILQVPTLAERREELDKLVDELRNEVRRTLGIKLGRPDIDLLPRDRHFIGSHEWPENIEELSRYVERVLAIRGCNGYRPAAKALGMSPGALIEWGKRYDVKA